MTYLFRSMKMDKLQDIINRIMIVVNQNNATQFKILIKQLARELKSTEQQAVDFLYRKFEVE